jgi:hypothetical protein
MNDITSQVKRGIPDDESVQTRPKTLQRAHASGLKTMQRQSKCKPLL